MNPATKQLFDAIKRNDLNDVMVALRNGADPSFREIAPGHTRRDYDEAPLLLAVKSSNTKIVQALINAGAGLNPSCPGTSNGLLHIAVISNNLEVVQALINAGAYLDECGSGCLTPLCLAASIPNVEIAKALIDAGADIERCDKYNMTPLHHFISCNCLEGIILLIASGAHIVRPHGTNAIEFAIRTNSMVRRKVAAAETIIKYTLLRNFNAEKPTISQTELSNYWDECKTEIEKFKSCIIGKINKKSISFDDFLTTSDDVKLISYLKNEDILEELKSKSYNEFPILGDIFSKKVQDRTTEGEKKKALYESTEKCLLKLDLPLPAAKCINQCLGNKHGKRLNLLLAYGPLVKESEVERADSALSFFTDYPSSHIEQSRAESASSAERGLIP